jgi:DNA polymerase III alpha subunit
MVSRNEGVKYSALHCDNLTKDFVVRNDEIVPGLSGIKGIGDKAMANVLLNAGTKYQSVDHFIEKNGKNKILMERLIKLGAFDHLFPNRSALWMWYLLKHSTCKQSKEAKSYFKTKLGIPEKGKLNISFEEVVKLSPKWGLRKILFFEKDFFGYHFTSPMSCYKFSGHTIEDAAETNVMEVVIQDNELRQTKTNKKYLKLLVTDGTTSATLLIWDVGIIDNIEDVSPGSGIRVEVNWDEKFNSYSLRRNSKIVLLDKDD